MEDLPVCAILDDYQDAALSSADWTALSSVMQLRRHHAHLGGPDDVVAALRDCEVIIAMRERTAFPAEVLKRLPCLRLLVTTGMRNRSIDMTVARTMGIDVCGTRGEAGSAAELAWGGLLAFMRRIPAEAANLRAGGPWQTGLGRSLEGLRLGIVGLGKQGSMTARFGQAFGMEVCGWTRSDLSARAARIGVVATDLPTLFRDSDVVMIQLALTPETRGIIGADLLARMKPDAVLVNTARGPLVDEAALIAALRAERIGGAVLDVFDTEPLPDDHPFRHLPNVLATPHLGYVTSRNYALYYGDAVEDILSWRAGTPLRLLNPPKETRP